MNNIEQEDCGRVQGQALKIKKCVGNSQIASSTPWWERQRGSAGGGWYGCSLTMVVSLEDIFLSLILLR